MFHLVHVVGSRTGWFCGGARQANQKQYTICNKRVLLFMSVPTFSGVDWLVLNFVLAAICVVFLNIWWIVSILVVIIHTSLFQVGQRLVGSGMALTICVVSDYSSVSFFWN